MDPDGNHRIFHNRQRSVRVDADRLERFARELARTIRLRADSFSAVLVSDRRMRELNRRFRNRSAATDVLSFPMEEAGFLGDVVISAETARRQARQLRHPLSREIEMLLLHGVLHLMGYDHETDRGQMDRRELALRRRLGLE